MKTRKTKGILVMVILPYIIMGCTTVITRDYGSRQFSTPLVMQNMTQERAIALVYHYCLVHIKSGLGPINPISDVTSELLTRSGNDLGVDSSGFSYTYYKFGPFHTTSSRRGWGYTEYRGYRGIIPERVQVNFADVKRIKYDNWEYRINLYDGNGHKLFVFYHVGYNCKYTPSFACGKDKKEELMAALLILSPNVP